MRAVRAAGGSRKAPAPSPDGWLRHCEAPAPPGELTRRVEGGGCGGGADPPPPPLPPDSSTHPISLPYLPQGPRGNLAQLASKAA